MLRENIFSLLIYEDGNFPVNFKIDGAPYLFGIHDHQWLDQQYSAALIGLLGPVEWPHRSPNHTSLDFSIWGHLKAIVYQVKILNISQLQQRITNAIICINSASTCFSPVEDIL